MLLAGSILPIPADAEIERQLVCDLPGVLHIHSHACLPSQRFRPVPDAGAIRQSHEKAGIRESDGAAAKACGLQVRKTGLSAGEGVAAIGRAALRTIEIAPPFSACLEC